MNENVVCLGVSEQGIIGLGTLDSIKFFDVNFEQIQKTMADQPVFDLVFNTNGTCCIEIYEECIKFRDPTNTDRFYVVELNYIKDLVVHPLENSIFICRNKYKKLSELYIIGLDSKIENSNWLRERFGIL